MEGLRPSPPIARSVRGPSDARRRAGVTVTLGAILVIVGVFLPWVQASAPGGFSASVNGWQVGTWGTLLLAGFALLRGLSMLRPHTFRANLGTPVIGGLLLAVLMAARWGDLQDAIHQAEATNPAVTASLGIGVWCVIAGTAAIIVGGVLGRRP